MTLIYVGKFCFESVSKWNKNSCVRLERDLCNVFDIFDEFGFER